MTTPAPRRRWFRFALRTLFALVAVVGVGFGWLGVQLKWIRDRNEARRQMDADDGIASYDDRSADYAPFPAPWSLRMLGEPGVYSIGFTYERDERKHTEQYRRLFPECQKFWSAVATYDE